MPPKMILAGELQSCMRDMTNTEKVFWYAEAVLAQRRRDQWRKENFPSRPPPINRPMILRRVILEKSNKKPIHFPTPSIESLIRRYQPVAPAPPRSPETIAARVVKSPTNSLPGSAEKHFQMIKKYEIPVSPARRNISGDT